MTTATLELYNALLEAGVSKEKAEATARTVITREEAKETLATKGDLASVKEALKEEIFNLRAEMYKSLLINAGVIISSLTVVIALINFFV